MFRPPGLDLGDALFLDLDGTLAPIAPRPDGVPFDPQLARLMAQLEAAMGGAVAVISGRTVEDVRRILGDSPTAIGAVHGLTLHLPGGRIVTTEPPPQLAEARSELQVLAQAWPGLLLEDKGLGVALHFRQAPAAEPTALVERSDTALVGYQGMGPVRVGNAAYVQHQHDVYGQVVLSSVQAFFDQRLLRPATAEDFQSLEAVGERAFLMHDQPDAGLWEYRTRTRVHTYSALMGWAACDRLANAADAMGLAERAVYWRAKAGIVRARIEKDAWNAQLGRFAGSFGGDELDASLLQLVDLQFLDPADERYVATLAAGPTGRQPLEEGASSDLQKHNSCEQKDQEALGKGHVPR